ncbi:MAG: metal ABC transporter permease [Acidimicrobiales bacterium]
MFSAFMTNTWLAVTVVAVTAGAVGFFVVLRNAAFSAHALPNGAFAGAAFAAVTGMDPLGAIVLFSLLAAGGIGLISRRGRHDVATALVLVALLALGSALLSRTSQYGGEVYSVLFGEPIGAGSAELIPTGALALGCLVALGLLWRPLLLSTALPQADSPDTGGGRLVNVAFLVLVALSTAMTVPVVGALLVFALMIGPPAAACALSDRPATAMALSIAFALVTAWASVACSYATNWPTGFFVGAFGAGFFCLGTAKPLLRRVRPAFFARQVS